MPQLDKYHEVVRRAFIKAGWTIVDDPLYLRLEDIKVFIDLAVERDDESPVAIEIKVLEPPAQLHQLATALGQYLIYRTILTIKRPHHRLYLAVPEEAYYNLLNGPTFQKVLADNQIDLVIYHPEREELLLWTR